MTIHDHNVKNLKIIVDYINNIPDIEEPIPSSKQDLRNLYRDLIKLVNTLIHIYKIRHNKELTKNKKICLIAKIKEGGSKKKIFTKKDSEEVYNNIDKIGGVLRLFQKGGDLMDFTKPNMGRPPNTSDNIPMAQPMNNNSYNSNYGTNPNEQPNLINPIFFLSDLEDKYGSSLSIPLEIISSSNSMISYFCSMLATTFGYPPFSIPPYSLALFFPKLILRFSHLFLTGYNMFINISRRNWGVVIKNGLSSFPQFLITENQVTTQLLAVKRTLKMLNQRLEAI